MKEYKEYMIAIIRKYQYYKNGELERMSESQVKSIYESLIDWIG